MSSFHFSIYKVPKGSIGYAVITLWHMLHLNASAQSIKYSCSAYKLSLIRITCGSQDNHSLL